MIGPFIPEHLLKKKRANTADADHAEQDSESHNVDDNAQPHMASDRLQQDNTPEASGTVEEHESDVDADDFMPELPPDLLEAQQQKPKETPTGGPRRRAPVGPTMPTDLPSAYDSEDDDDVIGPTLPTDYDTEEATVNSAIKDIEERARQTREAMLEAEKPKKPEKVERAEWMLVPPEVDYLRNADSSHSRGFSATKLTAAERDRSVWTDTPAERERKQRESGKRKRTKEAQEEPVYINKKELETKYMVEQFNATQRPKSLMELHREKGKKTRAPTEDVSKRGWDREKDLLGGGSRPMDKRQKKELLQKSRELGSRFGHGSSTFI